MDYEKYLFHRYKDKSLPNRKVFINGICSKFRGVDGGKLYKEILDYQIFYYGSQLHDYAGTTREERKKGLINSRKRRRYHGLK